MFFRRGRLNAKKAHALLIELFDHHFQWPLRTPIVQWIAQGDPVRFLYSLRLSVDQIGRAVYLLNRKLPPECASWYAGDLNTATSELPLCPANLVERLSLVMRQDDPLAAEVEIRRLMLEIIALASQVRKQSDAESELAPVSWWSRVADLETTTEPPPASIGDQASLRRIAQRAVRIVWRLPGSRLAAITGSVAAGFSDLASDINISLFGLKLPEVDVRRSLIAATSDAPDDITQLTRKQYATDAFWLKDHASGGRLCLINVRYFLIKEAQRLIENPTPESQADNELLAHLSTADILVDYELLGSDLLDDLQKATCQAQSERVRKASAGLDQALARLQANNDSLGILGASTDAVLGVFQLLAARNDRWIVYPKQTTAWLDDLTHVPPDVHQRLSSISLLSFCSENANVKIGALRTLADEILAL